MQSGGAAGGTPVALHCEEQRPHRELRAQWAVTGLTKAVQNVLKPVHTLKQVR